MNNTLEDLNNHLFAQLERLGDDMTDEELARELRRSDGMAKIATQIIQNGELAYRAARMAIEYGNGESAEDVMPAMLEKHRKAPTALTKN